MPFPKITDQQTIVFPKLETLSDVREAELGFQDWIKGKFYTKPKPRDIYVFEECVKPAFEKLDQENRLSGEVVKEYGKYLRDTAIYSSKNNYLVNKNYTNIFQKIIFYIQISWVSWKLTATEDSAIRICKLAGKDFEQKITNALNADVNFSGK